MAERMRDPATGRLLPNSEAQREAEIARALGREVQHEIPHETYESVDTQPRVRRKPFERKPFGTWDQKLNYPPRDGYKRYWFNDEPGRIMRAHQAGYEKVEDEDGRPVSTVVGIGRGGQPLVAFLLEIPQSIYEEDMAAQEMVVHDLLAQIGRGEHTRPQGQDGAMRYAGKISIETGNSRR